MVKIGNLLREKRLEKGLTIEDISEKTRLTTKHIKAIEEGDISYFKDDLSYLRFFLKSYCEAVDVDFEPIKEELRLSIEDFTMTSTQNTVIEHEAIERSVRESAEKIKQTPTKDEKPKKLKKPKQNKQRRKPDVSLLSFLAIVIVVFIGLVFAFVMWMQGNKNEDNGLANNQPPVAEAPGYTSDPEKPVTPPKEEPKEMTITTVNDGQYTIENVTKDSELDIEITFGSNSSFRALVNDKELSDPVKKIYNYKTVIHVREKVADGKKIQLAFGFMQNNAIKVNGKEVKLADSLVNKQGSAVVEFTIKGE